MGDFPRVFPGLLSAGRFRRGSLRAASSRRFLSGLMVAMMIAIAAFATTAGSLSIDGAKASQSPPAGRASKLVEAAFASFNIQSAKAGAVTLEKKDVCRDVTYYFLHCSTPRKSHFGRTHRKSKRRSAVLARNVMVPN